MSVTQVRCIKSNKGTQFFHDMNSRLFAGVLALTVFAQRGLRTRRVGHNRKKDRVAHRRLQRSLSYQRNFDALLGLGLVFSERHHFMEALPYVREALDAMPGNGEAEAASFDIHLALGEVAAAEKVSSRMVLAHGHYNTLEDDDGAFHQREYERLRVELQAAPARASGLNC